jgi:hypothetical protein
MNKRKLPIWLSLGSYFVAIALSTFSGFFATLFAPHDFTHWVVLFLVLFLLSMGWGILFVLFLQWATPELETEMHPQGQEQ